MMDAARKLEEDAARGIKWHASIIVYFAIAFSLWVVVVAWWLR